MRTSASSFASGCLSQLSNTPVEVDLPAQYSQHKSRRQVDGRLLRVQTRACRAADRQNATYRSQRLSGSQRQPARRRDSTHGSTRAARRNDCSAAQKLRGSHALLAFQLQLDDLEPRVLRAGNLQVLICEVNDARVHLRRSSQSPRQFDAQSVSCRPACVYAPGHG